MGPNKKKIQEQVALHNKKFEKRFLSPKSCNGYLEDYHSYGDTQHAPQSILSPLLSSSSKKKKTKDFTNISKVRTVKC